MSGLCSALGVKITAFLGNGATARCFRVLDSEGNSLVLKSVLTCQMGTMQRQGQLETLVAGEFSRMISMSQIPHVMRVVPDSLTRIYNNNTGHLLGLGFLMCSVGEQLVPERGESVSAEVLQQLFMSLASLHKRGCDGGWCGCVD